METMVVEADEWIPRLFSGLVRLGACFSTSLIYAGSPEANPGISELLALRDRILDGGGLLKSPGNKPGSNAEGP